MKTHSAADIVAGAAHVLAWGAFLWLAFWPFAYQGVTAAPVQVDELGNRVGNAPFEVDRHSASFVEVNGVWGLIPLFIPVVLTGLGLMVLLTWKGSNIGLVSILWALSIILLAFCLATSLSFGVLYTPSALALIISAAIYSTRLRLPRVPQE